MRVWPGLSVDAATLNEVLMYVDSVYLNCIAGRSLRVRRT